MPRRFWVDQPLAVGKRRLAGPQAHHLIHVLRIGVGERVVLFDGGPLEAGATVTGIAEGAVELAIDELSEANTELVTAIVLGAAVPKGDRFGWLIEKATELGVTRFVPLVAERSVVHPGEGKLDKMRRTVIEASKQCGRARLMEIASPMAWPDFVERELSSGNGWVAHIAGQPLVAEFARQEGPIVAAVGPEGGFTDAELELATRAGAKLVSLGPRVLRIATAALTLAALLTAGR
ncbi:MAG TPA: RsmE family RNA methyltransferase [Planctomycetaceae bacterium]|nr:RsmE family RNA methyltransferase [Planctomycetaceae bacterium]